MRLLAVLLAVLVAAGCAAIPTETSPIAVNPSAGNASEAAAPKPVKDIDPLTLVREFVNASANPEGDYAAAKAYLTEDAKKAWNTKGTPTIIDTTFNTVPTPGVTADDKHRIVLLQGRNVGRLQLEDNSFIQLIGPLDTPIGIERDAEDQWRISAPPDGIYVPLGGFQQNYRRVTLFFYSPDFSVLVPDPRWVVIAPSTSIPSRVTSLLLKGPAVGMRGALASAIPNGAAQRKNTSEADDGALEVDLTKVGDITVQAGKQIVAQVVRSLAGVSSSRIRVLVEGQWINADQHEWRPADVQTGEELATPIAGLNGMLVGNGRVKQVNGDPVPGPAGAGDYQVLSAGQSMDGSQLAVVSRAVDGSARLRVGPVHEPLAEVDLHASAMTRPTWLLSGRQGEPSNEVWTVADGNNVVRVIKTDRGWTANAVNASELTELGGITELRLSRDGTRVAAVVDGKLVVAAVVRGQDSAVSLRSPRHLQPSVLGTSALALDWLAQDVLVVSTSLVAYPIAKVNIDGVRVERYNTSNLTVPVASVTAAPGRNVLAVDQSGLWSANDVGDVWRASTTKVEPGTQAFYPG
ncbi:LpqB family beta-propeller domain-containing protein [Saccharothrix sp. S26]|uniref:LpqB family beta-propeller domain-containing protein n=1 Tax=Saccharothrix sp. S26 TaxID=2907215 RepID=UPI001F46E346|nr:LpqB family beta-propeller domain-containing protein [Saccharothrix sp. S26]MCE6999318.1 LpqB family beta-propeller domain-containing protein [Saccharothrix sp. S26]